jgi:DNA-binding NarL/FixJ family response regulator
MAAAVVMDEWALVRQGISIELTAAGVDTVASVGTTSEGFDAVARTGAGVAVVGSCPDSSVAAAVGTACRHPGLSVIALVGSTSQRSLVELCSAGAHAVVVRSSGEPRQITSAMKSVLAGDRYLSPELVGSLFASSTPARPSCRVPVALTARERSVLTELAAGRTNDEIAAVLCIGTETVKTHLGNIYAKLAVKRRSEAVRVALQEGWL